MGYIVLYGKEERYPKVRHWRERKINVLVGEK
jgi:ribosomal protein L39E